MASDREQLAAMFDGGQTAHNISMVVFDPQRAARQHRLWVASRSLITPTAPALVVGQPGYYSSSDIALVSTKHKMYMHYGLRCRPCHPYKFQQ